MTAKPRITLSRKPVRDDADVAAVASHRGRGGEPRPRSCNESEHVHPSRRQLLGAAALALVTTPLGAIAAGSAHATPSGPASSTTPDALEQSLPIKQIRAGLLDAGYAEWGPIDGSTILLLHGWPYDIHSFVEVAPLLASKGYRVIAPYVRGYGATRFLSSETLRNGQPAALALDVISLMDALKIRQAVLAGFDWGARTADVIAALWPERCKALVSVSGYLITNQAAGEVPLPPTAELSWWYQFYFATERGRAGYGRYRHDFAKLIWRQASPQWDFDDATFDRTAKAFDNPDHVAIVIHNYRWRQGLAQGEAIYDAWERRLAAAPTIRVPTITLEGDANGAPHPQPSIYAQKFSGRYEHRLIGGGVGHNLPQEAPRAFAQAVVDADRSAAPPDRDQTTSG